MPHISIAAADSACVFGGPAKAAALAPAKAIVLLLALMVLEDLAVQNARRPETFADPVRDIPDPEMPVIVGSIKVAAMDNYAMAAVPINVPMAL
jgi:hypothetical protein